jgi:hypothetical protein
MTEFENFSLFLPRYLSPDTENSLLADLKDFPGNVDKRMYGFYGKSDTVIYAESPQRSEDLEHRARPDRAASCISLTIAMYQNLTPRHKATENTKEEALKWEFPLCPLCLRAFV